MLDTKDENISSEELFKLFLAGNNNAFEQIVALYENMLFIFIHNMVDDYHDAKHLMIETFARLALNSGNFKGESSLKTYIFAIGRNLALRYIKKHKSLHHVSYESSIETLIGEGETPDQFMEKEENKRYLAEAMRDLKEEYRVVLELLYFEDMSYKEAAQVMKKNVAQVNNLSARAKAALKRKLEEREFEFS